MNGPGRPMAGSPQALRAAARGDRLADQGRLLDALRSYEQALRLSPQLTEARINAGLTLSAMGKHADALAALQRAVVERPDLAAGHLALGDAQRQAGDLAAAEASYRRALERAPRLVGALCNLGGTLRRLGRLDEAIEVLDRAVALAPDSAASWLNRANALQDRGKLVEAEAAFRRTLALAAGNAEALAGLGANLQAQTRYAEAVVPLERALALRRDDAVVLAKLAHVSLVLGRQSDARRYLQRGAARAPDSLDVRLLRSFDRLLHGKPGEAAALLDGVADLDQAALAKVDGTRLLYRMHDPEASPAALLAEHRAWAAKHEAPLYATWRAHANDRAPDRVLRVGFVSADLRNHAVATFLEPLLAALDRTRIEPVLYANVARLDAVSARLQALARWEPIAGEPADAVAERIRAHGVDILVDLAGHTMSSQLLIFAHKPAPVQATWLGYPGTTGLTAIDWRISDAVCDPPEDDALSSERLLRLDGFHCYAGPADAPAVTGLPAASADGVTFGSFNNIVKLSDPCVALYARVLAAVPGSRLLLKSGVAIDEDLCRHHVARFAAHGIAADRVAMLPWASNAAAHLTCYGAVDIAPDGLPYCGTTTTCEALWMGVPVVTLVGDRHAARVGASLLRRVGLDRLAARSADAFVAIAADLAPRREELAALRAGLRARPGVAARRRRGLRARLRGRAARGMAELLRAMTAPGARAPLARSFMLDTVVTLPVAQRARFLEKLAWELDHGHWPLAEAVTLTYLGQFPEDPQAWLLAAHLAWRVGLKPAEAAFLRNAARLAPGDADIKRRLAATRAAARGAPSGGAGRRFLVAKSCGFGFWSDVNHVLGCALLAKIADRVPVVHWGKRSLFGDGSDADHFTSFFAPLAAVTMADVAAATGAVYPAPYMRARLGDDVAVVPRAPHEVITALHLLGSEAQTVVSDLYCGVPALLPFLPQDHALAGSRRAPGQSWLASYRRLAAKYLRPRPEIAGEALGFVRERLQGGFVAIHLRGTDKAGEIGRDEAERVRREAFALLAAHATRDPAARFFIMTDDTDMLAAAIDLLGERAVYTDAARLAGSEGLHNTGRFPGVALGREVLRDVLVAVAADSFIGTGTSNVAAACAYMRDWPADSVTLLNRPIFMDRPIVFARDMKRLHALVE